MAKPIARGRLRYRVELTGMEVDILNDLLNAVYGKSDGMTRRKITNIQRKLDEAPQARGN